MVSSQTRSLSTLSQDTSRSEIIWDCATANNAQDDQFSAVLNADLRILMENPGVWSLVQYVLMRGLQNKSLGRHLFTNTFSQEERNVVKIWLREAKLPTEWMSKLDHGRVDYLAALFLSRFPEVVSLELQTWDRTGEDKYANIKPDSSAFGTVLQNILLRRSELTATISTFQNLETVHISPGNYIEGKSEYDFYVYFENILPLFYLPIIRTIELSRIDVGHSETWPADAPTTSSLTTLCLKKCQLSERKLDMMLQASPNLKKLQCEICCDADYVQNWFDATRVGRSLINISGTVEHLDFSLKLWTSAAIDTGNPGPWGVRGSLGSLKDFGRLAHLSVSWPVLLGWNVKDSAKLAEVLPDRLQSVTFTDEMYLWYGYLWDDCDSWADESLNLKWYSIEMKIIEYLESRPLRLKKLRLDLAIDGEGDVERMNVLRDKLGLIGNSSGVEVEVVKLKLF